MTDETQPESTPGPAPMPVIPPPAGKKSPDRSTMALELSKVIIPVIGTIIAACLSGIFLILNNSDWFSTARVKSTPTIIVVTATPLPPTSTALPPTLTPTPLPSPTPIPATPTQPGIVTDWKLTFKDDFSDPNSGWSVLENEFSKKEYVDGGYVMTIKVDGQETFVNPTLNRILTDMRIEVDTLKLAGNEPYEIGVFCRNETANDFYSLSYSYANKVGKFGIYRWTQASYQTLGEVVITDPTWINPGKQTNRLRAECVGDRLSLYVNDKKAIEVQDAFLRRGGVGMFTGYSNGVQVLFDNFTLYEPVQ